MFFAAQNNYFSFRINGNVLVVRSFIIISKLKNSLWTARYCVDPTFFPGYSLPYVTVIATMFALEPLDAGNT